MEVFTEEWSQACCARMNASAAYRQAAADWVGAVVLVMTADPAQGAYEQRAVFIDMERGVCHGSRVASAVDRADAAYVLQADPGTWRRLLSGDSDAMSMVMTGKLKLAKGNMFTLAKYAKAAREMVNAAGEVGGEFPSARG